MKHYITQDFFKETGIFIALTGKKSYIIIAVERESILNHAQRSYIFVVIVAIGSAFAGEIIYVDACANGYNNGSSWAKAYNHLQDALSVSSMGDEIWVAKGIYKPDLGIGITPGDRTVSFQLKNGVSVYGGFPSGGSGWENRNPNVYETILSGDLNSNDGPNFANSNENSYHIVIGSGVNSTAVLDGFTITGGNANGTVDPDYRGGGMYINSGTPTITNCIFSWNLATWGAGIHNESGSPTLTNCVFKRNSASYRSGGMYNRSNSSPVLTNCIFIENSAVDAGGGMGNGTSTANPILTNCIFEGNSAKYGGGMSGRASSSPTLNNCTFYGNTANDSGGGIWSYWSETKPKINNCIIWANSDSGGVNESAQIHDGTPVIKYSCIQGWTGTLGGVGNIGSDPCFADANNGDYHLKSQAGRWKQSIFTKLDPTGDNFIDLTDFAAFASSWQKQGHYAADLDNNGLVDFADLSLLIDDHLKSYLPGKWVTDDITSPCIDAGSPNSYWSQELWPHGLRINMGAFGGTKQASMSQLNVGNVADLNFNGYVNYEDLKLFSCKWLQEDVLLHEDVNRNGIVNFADFAVLASEWLWEGQGSDCEAVIELRRLINEEYSYWQLRGIDWDHLFEIYSPAMNEAQTPEEFAELAAEVLSNAEDPHISMYVGTQKFTVFSWSVERNYNLNVLPTLVPNWQIKNNRVRTGYFNNGNIGYIWISSWSSYNSEELNAVYEALNSFSTTDGLIIDVRANGGGSESLAQQTAGCFIPQSKLYAKCRFRDTTQPDGFGPILDRWVSPNSSHPTYTGPVVVLMGQACMSSCEAFLLMMKQVPGCMLVGATSYGSSGNPKSHNLPNGVSVYLPSWLALRPDGTCIEGEGISPHIPIQITQEELLTHDPILEAALNTLR